MEKLNEYSTKLIKNSNEFTKVVYTKEDLEKYEYVTTMLNLELNVASKLTKWFTSDGKDRIAKTKQALDIYVKLDKYIQGFYKFKGFKGVDDVENEQVR
jgi:hypothetical protein